MNASNRFLLLSDNATLAIVPFEKTDGVQLQHFKGRIPSEDNKLP